MTDREVKKHQDVFVVARYFDNAVSLILGAFMSFDEAQTFSDLTMTACRAPHEVEITRCAPTPCETWRRFSNDRRWSDAWQYRRLGEKQ